MVTTASGVATVPALTSTPSSVPARPNESSPTRSSQVRPGPESRVAAGGALDDPGRLDGVTALRCRPEARAPGAQLAEHGRERPAGLGQLVDGDRRGTREGALLDDALLLQTGQAVGEDVGADAGQPVGQVGEPLGPEQQLADDERRPALADDVERDRGRTALAVALHALRRYQRAQTILRSYDLLIS